MKVLNYRPKWLDFWLLRSLTIIVGLIIFPSIGALAADPLAGKYPTWKATSPSTQTFNNLVTPTGNVNLTGTITTSLSPTGSSQALKVNITNIPSQLSNNYFLFGQFVNNRAQLNEIKFTTNLPIDKVSMAIFDISANYYYRDKVIIYGLNSTSATPNKKISPVLNSKYDAATDSNIASTPSADGLIINSLAENYELNSIVDNRTAQGITFNEPIDTIVIKYGNAEITRYNNTSPNGQVVGVAFDNFEAFTPPLVALTKDDGVTKVYTGSTTSYSIVVKNIVTTPVSGVTLADPIAAGLSKQTNLTCDTSVANNICSSTTLPSVTQLESGYALPTIPVGYNYAIKVPTLVNSTSGYVTNTATVTYSGLTTPIKASDTDEISSPFDSGSIASPGTCPVGHQRYMISNTGATAPTLASWVAGATSRVFNFSTTNGPIKFTISFTDLLDTINNSPYYGNDNNGISDSLYMSHQSTANIINHVLNLKIDKPVSQAGFIIQDLDAQESSVGTSYREQVDVSTTNGKLTYVPGAHTINSQNNIVTAIKNESCNLSRPCSINADWGYKPANTMMTLIHKNLAARESTSKHELGYSSFYYCLAPPKLIVKKVLTGDRVENDDEFKIDIKQGATVLSSFTTAGDKAQITPGSEQSPLISLSMDNNPTFTITESVVNNGSIANYKTSYKCVNSTTSSQSVMPTGEGSSFTLSGLNYGDEITCTITNKPDAYTFSGIVFNDNGGISSANKDDVSSTYTGNAKYFNGQYDAGESGIYEPGLKVAVTDCNNNIIGNAKDVTSSGANIGRYNITVPASTLFF